MQASTGRRKNRATRFASGLRFHLLECRFSLDEYGAAYRLQQHTAYPLIAVVILWLTMFNGATAASFTTFESGPVRPLALSTDGSRLFVVNIPDGHLEIFSANGGSLMHIDSVAVGLEPVAVAVHNDGEVWVVNHLSDSVSVVDVSVVPARVIRTLLVGDELPLDSLSRSR